MPGIPLHTARRDRHRRKAVRFGVLAALLAGVAAAAAPARAQVSVTGTYLTVGSEYLYNLSVTNSATLDLAIVSILVPNLPATIINPTAPAGFGIQFDSTNSLLDFFEDFDPVTPQTFAPGTTVSGFQFRSNALLNGASFTALDAVGNTFTGAANAVAVPEPGTAALLALGVAPLGLAVIRRRRACRTGASNPVGKEQYVV